MYIEIFLKTIFLTYLKILSHINLSFLIFTHITMPPSYSNEKGKLFEPPCEYDKQLLTCKHDESTYLILMGSE